MQSKGIAGERERGQKGKKLMEQKEKEKEKEHRSAEHTHAKVQASEEWRKGGGGDDKKEK
jgi:hypothetical protein